LDPHFSLAGIGHAEIGVFEEVTPALDLIRIGLAGDGIAGGFRLAAKFLFLNGGGLVGHVNFSHPDMRNDQ
jgi:hypothetical protein